jgi:tripartite ATP-independent transporter DctP family solute receptor
LLVSACGGTGTGDGVIEMQVGSVSTPGSLLGNTAEEFVRRVNASEVLAGRVHMAFFGSSQLGNDEMMLQKLRLGTLDFSVPSTIMSSTVEEFGLFELPYLVENRRHMTHIKEEIVWPMLAPAAEGAGYHLLAVWENGFRHITNNVRPIVTPADLAGIKLRTPQGRWRVRLFQAIGANPTPMPLSEVFVALQTGVIDGQENPLPQISSNKFQEVQSYLSLTGHVYTPAYLMTGIGPWRGLPEDVRTEIQAIARAMEDYIYAEGRRLDDTLMAEFEASGIAINEADRASFLEASHSVYDEFAETVPAGREMIDRAISLAERQ